MNSLRTIWLAAAFALGMSETPAFAADAPTKRPPNIILILADDK